MKTRQVIVCTAELEQGKIREAGITTAEFTYMLQEIAAEVSREFHDKDPELRRKILAVKENRDED